MAPAQAVCDDRDQQVGTTERLVCRLDPGSEAPPEILSRFTDCSAWGRAEPAAAKPPFAASLVQALRVHQWTKNAIILTPVVTSHQIANPRMLLQVAVAVVSLSLCASAMYVLNDLVDLENDRRHPTKRSRPFASGALSLRAGWMLWPLLLAASFVVGLFLPLEFLGVLLAYAATTVAYSLHLKRLMLVDVFTLAALYTLRLVAGNAATGVAYSAWLLGFAMFLFLSLALIKRVAELHRLRTAEKEPASGWGYVAGDLELLEILGLVSGGLAVLVFATYVTSADVQKLYHHPFLLLLACPLLFYWITRLWLIVHRGNMHTDPVVFTLGDRAGYVIAALTALILFCAT